MKEDIIELLLPIIAVVISYYLGRAKTMREEKLKLYVKFLPQINNAIFGNPKHSLEYITRHYNLNTTKTWLYGHRSVAFAVDRLSSVLVDPKRGDKIECLQELIAAMRNDIQIWPWQRIDVPDIKHIHMIFKEAVVKEKGKK